MKFNRKLSTLLLISVCCVSFSRGWWWRSRRRRCGTRNCDWTWGSCSRTCGGGTQSPKVTRAKEQCGSCNLPSSRRCNTDCCPRNCYWASWGSWRSCSRSCGGGVQTKYRGYSQSRRCGGSRCYGSSSQSRSCGTQCCEVNCRWSPWGPFPPCSASCGGGEMSRSRTVAISASCGGDQCPGRNTESEACNTQSCPINCIWSDWENWGECSATCGGGSQTKERAVEVTAQYGGKMCTGTNSENKECNEECCPVDCVWGEWESWNKCSKTCERGTQSRQRKIITLASCGGLACAGNSTEEQSCSEICCPVDCVYSEWEDWGSCSRSCDDGNQTRYRQIEIEAACDGRACGEEIMQARNCNTNCCPVDCEMTEWGKWSECSATCGPHGSQTKNRTVSVFPSCDGEACPEEDEQEEPCNRICYNGGFMTSTRCVCSSGWAGECCGEDVNECKEGSHSCHENAICNNAIGSYTCTCLEGFYEGELEYSGESGGGIDFETGMNCLNEDECLTGNHNCHPYATCTDNTGSYICECGRGFVGNGIVCTDLNECESGMHNCGINTQCSNIDGGFTCTCLAGYTGSGEQCSDIDECLSETTHNCHSNADCINNEGNFSCSCRSGYTENGNICEDINECSDASLNNCHVNADCFNTNGTYECVCIVGFIGTGVDCTNENECLTGNHDCHHAAQCTDLPGDFLCSCLDGYTGDGFNCKDEDECSLESHNCSPGTTCVNTEGGFSCECEQGYVMSNDTNACEDVNECEAGDAGCDAQAECSNLPGSFQCSCHEGYTGDGFTCEDIDECGVRPRPCSGFLMECRNTPGNYECYCLDRLVYVDGECVELE